MKNRLVLSTINKIALGINLVGGFLGGATLSQSQYNYAWLLAGVVFCFVAFIYFLVIEIWIDNGNNLALMVKILEDKK